MTRVLAWDGCVNVRDLGGLPIDGGGETAYRVVVRSDSVRELTDAGWQALGKYGVERIVDLRWAEELAEDPPGEAAVDVVHVPLLGPARSSPFGAELEARLDATDDPVDYYRWSYLRFLEEFQPNFAAAVAALADADGPAVVHCAGGKDRTGLVCALALRLAGVPAEAVEDDWVLSEAAWDHDREEWIASAPDEVERNRRRIWSVAPRPAMAETIAELERRYGGARGYLEDAGMRPSALERLRARLRGEA
ncbi:MAG TPA: tyrosine-protein phosphatase [Gaiellaceae bacterium]|nr:tyrosine-protein phosphatase [Gaiellaceae bacterium]